MSERGKTQLGKKDLVKEALTLIFPKGARLNKDQVNVLVAKKVKNVTPKVVNAALIDLIEAAKIKVESVNGRRIFSV